MDRNRQEELQRLLRALKSDATFRRGMELLREEKKETLIRTVQHEALTEFQRGWAAGQYHLLTTLLEG